VDGYFELPQGPGIGADLNLEEVRRHPYAETEMSLFEDDWQFRRTKPRR
jgi:galactonate dehydratase